MAGRSGRRRVDHDAPLVDLEVVFADDDFVDSIAASPWGARGNDQYAGGTASRFAANSARGSLLTADPLAELFQTWRQELAAVPIPAPPPIRPATQAAQPAVARRRRSLRPMVSIAAAIAALLVGSATIGSKDAAPNSALWGITKVLWPDRAVSYQSSENVRGAIKEARLALQAGRPQDAQLALLRATVELGNVDEVDGRGDMQQTVAKLWVVAAPPQSSTTAQVPDVPSDGRSSVSSSASTSPLAATSPAASAADPTTPAVAAPPAVDGMLAAADPGLLASAAVVAPPVGAGSVLAPPSLSSPDVLTPSSAPAADPPAAAPSEVDPASDTAAPPAESLPATLPPPVIPAEPAADPTTDGTPSVSATEQASAPTPSTPAGSESATSTDVAPSSSADTALSADTSDTAATN